MNNKRGFTLVELLAVIVILGIILIIATMSVNKVIKSSRMKAFDETALVATKAAKKALLSEEGTFSEAFKEEMDYDSDEYDFVINEIKKNGQVIGYKITLYAKSDGKFKNIDLNELTNQNKKFVYGTNSISFCIDSNSGKLTKESALGGVVSGDDPPEVIGGEEQPDIGDDPPVNEEDKFGKDTTSGSNSCSAMVKKETYRVNDVVWLCSDSGIKEEFFVLGVDYTNATISLVSKYAISSDGFQSKDNPTDYNSYASSDVVKNALSNYTSSITKNVQGVNNVSTRMVTGNDVFGHANSCEEKTMEYNSRGWEIYSKKCTIKNDSWIYMDKLYSLDGGEQYYGRWNEYYFSSLKENEFTVKTKVNGHVNGKLLRVVITMPLDLVIKK